MSTPLTPGEFAFVLLLFLGVFSALIWADRWHQRRAAARATADQRRADAELKAVLADIQAINEALQAQMIEAWRQEIDAELDAHVREWSKR